MDLDDEDDQPLRWYVIAAFMVTVVAGFGLAVLFTATWFTDCHEGTGTGTSTSFAGDSARGTLCESGHGAAGLLVPGGWLVGLALATFALTRWGGGGIKAVLLAALLLTPAALPAAAYAGLGPPAWTAPATSGRPTATGSTTAARARHPTTAGSSDPRGSP